MNQLNKLFELQNKLQNKLGTFPLTTKNRQAFINIQSLALIDEVMESLRETPWKPWKQQQTHNEENFKEELVDAWHFLINLSIASGMTSEELYIRFTKKNNVNHQRKDEGY